MWSFQNYGILWNEITIYCDLQNLDEQSQVQYGERMSRYMGSGHTDMQALSGDFTHFVEKMTGKKV